MISVADLMMDDPIDDQILETPLEVQIDDLMEVVHPKHIHMYEYHIWHPI